MALSEETKTAIDIEEVAETNEDYQNLYKWEHGQKVRGSQAKDNEPMKRYISDINKAWGKEKSYKDVYVNTFIGEIGKRIKDGDL